MRLIARVMGSHDAQAQTRFAQLPEEYRSPLTAERATYAAACTDPEVLEVAIADRGRVRLAAAGAPGLTLEQQQELVGHRDWRTRHALAENPHADAEVLAQLAGDPHPRVRAAVAAHVSTSAPTLQGMLEDTPRVARPAAWQLRRRWAITDEQLLDHSSPAVRSVAAQLTTDSEILSRLIADPARDVRWHAVRNPAISADQIAVLAGDADERIRTHIARTTRDSELQEHIARTGDAKSLDALGRNRSLSDAALLAGAGRDAGLDRELRRRFAARPELLPVAALDERDQAELAHDPAATAAQLTQLAARPSDRVRQRAAGHPSLPAQVRERLCADASPVVRLAAARAIGAVQQQHLFEHDPDPAVRARLMGDDPARREQAARSADPVMHEALVEHSRSGGSPLSAHEVRTLLTSESAMVRLAMLEQREISHDAESLQQAWARASSDRERQLIGRRRAAPLEARLVAFPHLPPDAQELAVDRAARDGEPELLALGARSRSKRVRKAAAGSPHTPRAHLERLASARDLEIATLARRALQVTA